LHFSHLADYELGDVLGVGTVGTIYAATERETGRVVAIKRLHPAISQDKNIRARFEREMLILERVRHPNIINYFGGGSADGLLFYVMERVDGGTVKELLEAQGSLKWPVVVELTRQICSALQCAHNHGVIHRDLKPGNLFLTREGEVKLGDFGIARDSGRSDLTNAGMTVGTHAYMAPEQITADGDITGKVDLYALGCCVFEMLTGRKVFAGENFAQLFEQHLHAAPPRVRDFVPDCPEPLDHVVNQLLQKDPLDRPFNARQVQASMIRVEETLAKQIETIENTAADVSADDVRSRGREMLVGDIRQTLDGPAREVSWGRLVIVSAVLVGLVALAAWMSQ